MYVYIYQRVHELPSRCIKEPPEAPVTATLIEGKKKGHTYRSLFRVLLRKIKRKRGKGKRGWMMGV